MFRKIMVILALTAFVIGGVSAIAGCSSENPGDDAVVNDDDADPGAEEE